MTFRLVALAWLALTAQAAEPVRLTATVRGQRQDLYCYQGSPSVSRGPVLFLTGDGGWRGFAIDIAETAASWGYRVCGMDTKRYLESFTVGGRRLKESEAAGDVRAVAAQVAGRPGQKVTILGWSEGADLGVLAASASEARSVFRGVVVLGLSESGVLGWRWRDDVTYLTRREPDEPHFATAPYLARVAPLPLVMLHSTRDEYTSLETARRMFQLAGEPKRFRPVEAQNHRFDGNHPDFFRGLREGLEWVNRTAP